MPTPPRQQIALAQKYGKMYGVDPKVLLAIGQHETGFGTLGAGRQGFTLGYGATDSGQISKYAGVENQYKYAAKTLAGWGVHTIADLQAGKASSYATDPHWEVGVANAFKSLGGQLPNVAVQPGQPQPGPPGQPQPAGQPQQGGDWQQAFKMDTANNLLKQSIALAQPKQGEQPAGNVQDFTQSVMGMAQQREQYQAAAAQFGSPQPKPETDPGGDLQHPDEPLPNTTGARTVLLAAKQIGQPYVWGGESRKEGGFDCSGLVDWAMRQQGYKGGRITTYSAMRMGHSVKGQPMQPGDWIIANGGKHMVIYAGNGKVIAAPHTGTVVQYQPVSNFNITDVRRV